MRLGEPQSGGSRQVLARPELVMIASVCELEAMAPCEMTCSFSQEMVMFSYVFHIVILETFTRE